MVASALRQYIPSTAPVMTERRSVKQVPNVRYSAETNGNGWHVDIYSAAYFRVRLGSDTGEVFRTIPGLLGFLFRSLGLTPNPGNGEVSE